MRKSETGGATWRPPCDWRAALQSRSVWTGRGRCGSGEPRAAPQDSGASVEILPRPGTDRRARTARKTGAGSQRVRIRFGRTGRSKPSLLLLRVSGFSWRTCSPVETGLSPRSYAGFFHGYFFSHTSSRFQSTRFGSSVLARTFFRSFRTAEKARMEARKIIGCCSARMACTSW